AEEAARHAGSSAGSADAAQAAATAAATAADSAAATATQAHKVADIARAADQERLDAQQAAEMAAAEDATREDILKTRAAAWEAGKASRYAAETEQLITDATAPGVDPKTAVHKGRQAALRLLDTGGPWAVAASEAALEGADDSVLAFLNTSLAEARDRDNRVSVLAISMGPAKLEQRLAAETAAIGSPEQVKAFLTTGQYPGKDDDDRVLLSQIMAAGGPGVKAAANKALDGTIEDVRAFLATGQYRAREEDNRVLVTQTLTNATPEVKAAAQAVLSGPAARLEPFLQSGLFQARQRDAFSAMHVATVNAYLADIDGSAALARQYAAEAGQSYATARGAAAEAANYAAQAQNSATQAADWSSKAAASATQAQGSATQAAEYAKQALANAASATAASRSADTSAAIAASYAKRARQYAATAKAAYNQALAEAAAAGRSRDQAFQAAVEAQHAVWEKQAAEAAASQIQKDTTATDPDNYRESFVEVQPRPGVTQVPVRTDMTKCIADDTGTFLGWLFKRGSKTWHKNDAGVEVCDVKVTVKVTGTVDYVLKTCPEPGLSVEACKGKYSTWDTLVLDTKTLENVQYETTYEMSYLEYAKHYKAYCGNGVCVTGDSSKLIVDALTGDFVKCFNNPGLNGPCAWAASIFLPVGTLSKAAKGIVAFRFAVETGIGIEEAKLALQATLDGYSQAVVSKLTAVADQVTAFRATLANGVGTEAALAALRNNAAIDRTLLREIEAEAIYADDVRRVCKTYNIPAGAPALLADGTSSLAGQLRTVQSSGEPDPSIFSNLEPKDTTGWTRIFTPGTVGQRTGNYVYVVLADGTLLIGKGDGHIALTKGADVLAAGEVRFKSGRMTEVNNKSGHYKPHGVNAQNAAVEAFNKVGLEATGKYVEYTFPDC
ncbi:hypothetical protein ABZ449_16775, partial [Kitasatospora sp. NPDC005856]